MGHGIAAPAVQLDDRAVHHHRLASDRRLFERYRQEGDVGAREELIARFLPLAHRLARRYWWGRDQVEDLGQVASVGLVKAIDRYDHERGVAFTSYVLGKGNGEVTGWLLRLRAAPWASKHGPLTDMFPPTPTDGFGSPVMPSVPGRVTFPSRLLSQ